MRIAIVGTGISGLVVAHRLHRLHDLTLFESGSHIGGHTRTRVVSHEGRDIPVDTGFIVFNERNYPRFTSLLRELGVESQPTTMSFSVRDDAHDFEYGGANLDALLCQRRNLLRPRFWSMIAGFRRFAVRAPIDAAGNDEWTTVGDYLVRNRYPRAFREQLILPMAAAIWSSPEQNVEGLPLGFFVRFFKNHGMLSVRDRPEWRTIVGGSRTYVEKLTAPFLDRIRLNTPVLAITRTPTEAQVRTASATHSFDAVVLACHADQSLRMLTDPSPAESEVLGAIPYRPNVACLHADESVLPRRRKAWSAWNYTKASDPRKASRSGVSVTYNMTILQRLGTRRHLSVTLNDTAALDPSLTLDTHTFEHPAFDSLAIRAQSRHAEISGVNRVHYCGAYWYNGFHEDGVRSGERVAEMLAAASPAPSVAQHQTRCAEPLHV